LQQQHQHQQQHQQQQQQRGVVSKHTILIACV
jgi:hypothetical protein